MLARSVLNSLFSQTQTKLNLMPKAFYYNKQQIGNREIVGYGIHGAYNYVDCVDVPMPGIRFKEPTPEIKTLLEKEKGDWKQLTVEEKKALYRYTFNRTFSEILAPTGHWKIEFGAVLWLLALSVSAFIVAQLYMLPPKPESFSPEARKAQLERIIQLRINPIQGLSSKYDYENNRWK